MEQASRLIATAAVACFIGAFALTPSEVRSRITPPRPVASAGAAPPPSAAPAAIPEGDPFAPRAADATVVVTPPVAPPPLALTRVGPVVPFVPPSNARVSAIAVGAHPGALIVEGDTTQLVTVGDRFDGTTVAAIDDGGVTLGDGRRLTLPAVGAPR
jgi:hypothetical protein